jgi:hypothetical protein
MLCDSVTSARHACSAKRLHLVCILLSVDYCTPCTLTQLCHLERGGLAMPCWYQMECNVTLGLVT